MDFKKDKALTRYDEKIIAETLKETLLAIRELSTNVLPLDLNEFTKEEEKFISEESKKDVPNTKKEIKIPKSRFQDLLEKEATLHVLQRKINKNQPPNEEKNLLFAMADSVHNLPMTLYKKDYNFCGVDLHTFTNQLGDILNYYNNRNSFKDFDGYSDQFFRNYDEVKEKIEGLNIMCKSV